MIFSPVANFGDHPQIHRRLFKVEIFASWGSYGPPDTPGSAGSGLHNTEQSNYSKCPEQLVNKCFTEDKSAIKKGISISKVKEKLALNSKKANT